MSEHALTRAALSRAPPLLAPCCSPRWAWLAAAPTCPVVAVQGRPSCRRTPLLGKFVWRDLVTENPDAVKPFYAALFGWEFEEGRALARPTPWSSPAASTSPASARRVATQPDQPVSQWLSFMSVADVDRAAEQTRAAGGSVVAGPLDLPNIGRGAVVLDPDGAPLGLLRSSIGDPADTPTPALNRFLWTEHLSRDPQASADFYAALVGFEVRKSDFGGKPYWVLVKGRERAGLLRNPIAVDRPIWLAYRPGGRPGRHRPHARRNWAAACCWPRAATCATARWR